MKLPINQIMNGDCLQHLKELPDNSVDSIITDPPYGLSFMNKHWDYDVPSVEIWKECLRVLKHGGHLLSFAGTRTYHRMVVNIEDAGFEIRDMISWLYGSGFPKSLNIGKQIDKLQENEREIVGKTSVAGTFKQDYQVSQGYRPENGNEGYKGEREGAYVTKGNSEWEGWGTALKPACEPIVVARKPLSEKNVALNVLRWGTGGINIDECRIGYIGKTDPRTFGGSWKTNKMAGEIYEGGYEGTNQSVSQQGRFPANIIFDEEAGKMLDEQSGELISGKMKRGMGGFGNGENNCYGDSKGADKSKEYFKNNGGASRFFYCAKSSKSERNLGCEKLCEKQLRYEDNSSKSLEIFSNQYTDNSKNPTGRGKTPLHKNNHPTVKPIKLMEYLVKLTTKKGQIVLDPFLGSGTTVVACVKIGRSWIGIEKEQEYIEIAQARINHFSKQRRLSDEK